MEEKEFIEKFSQSKWFDLIGYLQDQLEEKIVKMCIAENNEELISARAEFDTLYDLAEMIEFVPEVTMSLKESDERLTQRIARRVVSSDKNMKKLQSSVDSLSNELKIIKSHPTVKKLLKKNSKKIKMELHHLTTSAKEDAKPRVIEYG